MRRPKTSGSLRWRALARSGLILPGLLAVCGTLDAGDWWWIDNCATIPKGAITPPYGTHLSVITNGQHARAEVEKFVVSKHEWYMGGTEPGPAGRRHLAALTARLACTRLPIVIELVEPEELGDPSREVAFKLNEERRRHVVEYLASHGVADADRRVILGYPTAEGLYGLPAGFIGTRYLYSQLGRGIGGGFGGGGFGGAGLSGGTGTSFGGGMGGGFF
ncbi:MAG: hypothetical protein QOE66_3281 [Chloroflexota bacterium]|nr:hypothetical protein [Chloroflexota bacterium]